MEFLQYKKFRKQGLLKDERCHWCGRTGVEFMAIAKSVKFFCHHNCGFYAWRPKSWLTQEERRRCYGNTTKKKPTKSY